MLINGRFLARPPTGVDRFALELIAALSRRRAARMSAPGGAPSLTVAVPAGTQVRPDALPDGLPVQAVGRRGGHAWEQFELGRAAGAQPVLSLCNTAPLWRENQLVVIHDAAAVANPANYGLAFRTWYRLMHASLVRRARVVATVSRFSADELGRHYGARPRGFEVIPEGGEHILRQPADTSVIDRLGLAGRRYVLAVGSQSPNKNFRAVIDALALLDDPDLLLVAAGGGNSRVFADTQLADARLVRTGYVSDAQLRALYEGAACFAFPSYYEGFGLPPLEAMCCGCPVIVSDRASLPEVCGDAALYCRAEDPTTLARELRSLLASPARQDELRRAGRARAAHYGWDAAAAHFEQILEANFA